MRTLTLLSLAAAAVVLSACHSRGGYFSSDPELTYGPGVVEFPEPARVYLPEYRRASAAASIGVTTAAAQMARVSAYSRPVAVAAPPAAPPAWIQAPPPQHVVVGASRPAGWELPPGLQYDSGPLPRAPQTGTHRVMVYDHAGPPPAPLPPPTGARIGLHAGHDHGGAQISVQTR